MKTQPVKAERPLSAWFVSDLHIQDLNEERGQAFLRFLTALRGQRPSHLFLLGDVFDLWLGGHPYFIKRYEPILTELKALCEEGCKIHYFEGNHDLHLGPYWQGELGFNVHTGPAQLELGSWRVRLEHGDESDPDDRGYLFLRWFLRTLPLRFLALNLPGRAVAAIGEFASQRSRKYTSQTKTLPEEEIRARLHRHAEQVAKLYDFDFLLNGHVHVFDDFEFVAAPPALGARAGASASRRDKGSRRAVNLGSWLTRPYRAACLTAAGLKIHELS